MRFMTFFAMFVVLAAPAPSGTVAEPEDIPSVYAELSGDYEFYLNQQYLILSVFFDQGKLWERAAGESGALEMQPVDLAGLRFKIINPEKEQSAVFIRNQDGKITTFRMTINGAESIGLRIPAGGRPPRPFDLPFAVEDLRSDLLQIRRALEEMHPAVYGLTGKEAFERLYEQQLGRIDGPKKLGEFFQIAAPLVAAVGCGHTALAIPRGYLTAVPPCFFPLRARFVGGRAYVVRGADAAGILQPGSEILSINGRGFPDILKDLKALVSSDGSNDSYKAAYVEAAFPMLYAIQFGFPKEFVVEALPPGQKKAQEVRLQAIELSKVPTDPSSETPPTSSGDPNLDLRIIPDAGSAAVLTIRDFSYYQETEKFKGFIDESFARIRKAGVRHLILDLRGNGGGDPFCTTHLLSYLEPRPIPYFARAYPNYERLAEPIPRAAGAFQGKLSVLIDVGCFSSTGHLCALLKYHKIGTFIGAETGGTYECNDARRQIHSRNTRLRLFVARMAFTAAVEGLPRYQGIVPDIVVEPGIADIVSGKDPVLERALSLIADESGNLTSRIGRLEDR